ncbi:TPA: CD1107 family mobile element protein [Streptococcus suis]
MKQLSKLLVLLTVLVFGQVTVQASTAIPNEEHQPVGITVNPSASDPSQARGTVTENVDPNNQVYDIKEETGATKRQFLTFTTKSGKVFHLIINHDKSDNNVQLLTEVSEQDLLNLIEGEGGLSTPVQKVEPEKPKKEEEKKAEARPKSSGGILVFLIIGGVVLGVGYYIKVMKPKNAIPFDEFEEDEEEDFIGDSEDSELDE